MNNKLRAIQALNNMSKIKRSGPNLVAGINSENLESLAEHSLKVTYLSLIFGSQIPNVSIEKLLRYALLHDWGESILGDTISRSKSYMSYFDEGMKEMYKKAEGKAKEALLTDSNIKFPTLSVEEHKLFKFCDRLALVLEIIDIKQQGYKHSWIDKMYKIQIEILAKCDYSFVPDLLKGISEIEKRGYMENKYLTRCTDASVDSAFREVKITSIKHILYLLQTLNNLNKIKNATPTIFAGIPYEYVNSISEHSYRLCYLSLMFGYNQENINTEKLLKYAITSSWGKCLVGSVPTKCFSYSTYFDTKIADIFEKAEVKAKQILIDDAGLKLEGLNDDELSMYRFCDLLSKYIELIDLKQQGYAHDWFDKSHKDIASKIKKYDYHFVNELLIGLEELYKRGFMENKYLTKKTDCIEIS